MNLNLKGKNALVCGSTQGIGKACAEVLAGLGANITLCARNEDKLKLVCKNLDTSFGQIHDYIICNFSDSNTIDVALPKLLEKKKIHILINNTGGPPGGEIVKASEEEFLQAFNNHLICNHKLVGYVLKGMKEDQYGRIINIISTSVKIPLKGLGVSNTIRGAVANWSKTLSNEVAQYQVTVNNVLPGATKTERLSSIIENKARKQNLNRKDVENQMMNQVPMQRFAEAEEIANAVGFLASPAASYITGINVPVDGGRTGSL